MAELALFDMQDDVLVPTVHCYSLAVLKKIMDHYGYETSLEVYKYLFYMNSQNSKRNPFFNVAENEKEAAIFTQVDGSNFSPEDQPVLAGMQLCKLLFNTPTARAHRAMKVAIDNISEFLENTPVTTGRDGNLTSLVTTIQKFDGIRNSFKGVTKDLEEEQVSLARGGAQVAYDQ